MSILIFTTPVIIAGKYSIYRSSSGHSPQFRKPSGKRFAESEEKHEMG